MWNNDISMQASFISAPLGAKVQQGDYSNSVRDVFSVGRFSSDSLSWPLGPLESDAYTCNPCVKPMWLELWKSQHQNLQQCNSSIGHTNWLLTWSYSIYCCEKCFEIKMVMLAQDVIISIEHL